MLMRQFPGLFLGALLTLGVGVSPALADSYPSKPITLIIPMGAGGSHDLNARVFTSVMPEFLGQAIVVKLMPGVSGQRGTAVAARAKPDGYTLLFTHNYVDQLQQHIEPLPYDTTADLVTVARINFGPILLVVPADSPFKTLRQLLEYAKAHPGELTLAHSGTWGAVFVPAMRILQQVGAELTFTPYKGGGPAMRALLAGDADVTMAFPSVALSLVQKGKIRLLASAGTKRTLPDVPTFAELGFEDDIGMMNRVVMAPRGVAPEKLHILRHAFAQLNSNKTYNRLMQKIGENTAYMDGNDYEKLRTVQKDRYGALVRKITEN